MSGTSQEPTTDQPGTTQQPGTSQEPPPATTEPPPTGNDSELRDDISSIPNGRLHVPHRAPLERVTRISGFLQKPPVFTGSGPTKHEDYELWARKIKFYLSTVNPEYERLLDYAESSATPIVSQNYEPSDTDTFTKEEMKVMAADIRQTMFSFTTGAALVKLNAYSERTTDGFELWRVLSADYRLRDRDKAGKLLRDIMAYSFDENNYEDALLSWETMIAKYERTTMTLVPDEVKISTILSSTTGPLFEHLTLHADTYTTYNDVRRRVLDWHKTRALMTEDGTITTTNALYGDYYSRKGKGKWSSHYDDYHRRQGKGKSKRGKKGYSKGHYKGYNKGSYKGYSKGKKGHYKGKGKMRRYKGKGKSKKGKGKGKGKGRYYGQRRIDNYNANNQQQNGSARIPYSCGYQRSRY